MLEVGTAAAADVGPAALLGPAAPPGPAAPLVGRSAARAVEPAASADEIGPAVPPAASAARAVELEVDWLLLGSDSIGRGALSSLGSACIKKVGRGMMSLWMRVTRLKYGYIMNHASTAPNIIPKKKTMDRMK